MARKVKIFYDFRIYITLLQMVYDAEEVVSLRLQLAYQK